MKEYIIAASSVVTGYRRTHTQQVKIVYKESGQTQYGSTTTTYSSNTVSGNQIKYTYDVTDTKTGESNTATFYNHVVNYDLYRIDLNFDITGIPTNRVQSVKLRSKLTNYNTKSPLGYYVSSVGTSGSTPHFEPQATGMTRLASNALGYPAKPYVQDLTLSGLSSTGWYCLWNKLNGDYNNNETLTFDTDEFYLVITTDEEGTITTYHKTAKVRLAAGTYTAFVAVEGSSPMACLIKTSADVYVNYYSLEDREKLTFTLTAECDVWVSTESDLISNLMIVEGSDRTAGFIPYGDGEASTFIESFLAEEVVGYIPTVGINGHYEYDELNSEGTNTPGSASNPGVWEKPLKDQDRNFLTPWMINTFCADGIHKDFYLLHNNCTVSKVEFLLLTRCKNVNGKDYPTQDEIGTVDEGVSPNTGIRYYYTDYWTEIASDHATYAWTVTNSKAGAELVGTKIHFAAIPDSHVDGLVNIRVTYKPEEHEVNAESDYAKIAKCSVVGQYGYFNNNRFYFTGNPDEKGTDYESGVDDPTYFPEYGWTKVGSNNTAIQGYLHYGADLAIVKEDNNDDATVYMRTAELTDDGDIIFPVKQGAQGVGALSKWCLKTLHDEPLFLAKEGVYAIQGTDTTQERAVPSRSIYVDTKLRKDASKLCVAETFKDYYILCDPVSGRAYVADWRRSTEQLEWCVWDNIFASVLFATDDQLFFGTQDGKLCVFNFDWDNTKRYLDGMTVNPDSVRLDGSNPFVGGEAIHAFYVTKRDYLGTIDFKKTMLADGGKILIMPLPRSSASITLKTEKDEMFVDDIQTDSDEPAVVVPIRFRVKNFDSIETRIENNKPEEGLAILSVQYRYAITTDRR